MFKVLCFAFVFLSLIASCTKKPLGTSMDVSSSNIVFSLDAPSVVPIEFSPEKYLFVKELNTKDRVVFFYQDDEGYTHYYNGSKDIIINKDVMDKYKKMGGVPMYMSYSYDGKHLYFSQPVRWAQKKLIFIKLEPDGNVVYTKELSSLQQVLKPASIAFDGKGGMLLTWTDETPPYIKSAYILVERDNFPEKEEVISYPRNPVFSGTPVYTDKGFAIIYVKADNDKSGEIRIRYLTDNSEKVLYAGKVFDIDISVEKDSFLIRPYQMSLDFKLLTLNDSFETIKEYTIKKPIEMGEAFSLYTNGRLIKGEPFFLGGGSPPQSLEIDGYSLPQKPNIYYSYAGRDFERLVGGKPFMFTSSNPSFDSSEKYIVLAYTDMRFGYNTVMLAVFDIGGRLLKRDILIEAQGIETGTPRVVHLGGDIFRIFYPIKDKKNNIWIYRSKDINAESIDSLYKFPSMKERLEQLMDTARKFADCRKKNDYGCVYDLFDPTYRSGISKGKHEDMMKKINATIEEFRVESCKILEDSILAVCDSYMKAQLPKEIMGKPIKETQRTIEKHIKGEIWIFLDRNWYYVVDLPMLGYAQKW